MRGKLAGFVVLIISVLIISLAGVAPAAAATQDMPPPGCDGLVSSIIAGERLAVYCDYLPYPPYMYRAVAHCVAGGSFWYQAGYWVEPGFGPSIAECQGGLLSSARVVGYHVDER